MAGFFFLISLLLVLNSLITYLFFFGGELLGCSGGMDISCNRLPQPLEGIAEFWADIALYNLIARFMGGVGFILDLLAIKGLFYVIGLILEYRKEYVYEKET